ncbi:hypothetical protein MYMAC_000864 [Corallococcus macrosporus DSM 14697]|uniref:Uncharacterized protein n=1 Tax=Corallococcus macrosporus DSM 14697 TaxID=1189310 RepID=A0A250JN38_9BACT|nr:hypothetical protein MYMAC_000864 [Corallococcus macrosporus DSM 14697]
MPMRPRPLDLALARKLCSWSAHAASRKDPTASLTRSIERSGIDRQGTSTAPAKKCGISSPLKWFRSTERSLKTSSKTWPTSRNGNRDATDAEPRRTQVSPPVPGGAGSTGGAPPAARGISPRRQTHPCTRPPSVPSPAPPSRPRTAWSIRADRVPRRPALPWARHAQLEHHLVGPLRHVVQLRRRLLRAVGIALPQPAVEDRRQRARRLITASTSAAAVTTAPSNGNFAWTWSCGWPRGLALAEHRLPEMVTGQHPSPLQSNGSVPRATCRGIGEPSRAEPSLTVR